MTKNAFASVNYVLIFVCFVQNSTKCAMFLAKIVLFHPYSRDLRRTPLLFCYLLHILSNEDRFVKKNQISAKGFANKTDSLDKFFVEKVLEIGKKTTVNSSSQKIYGHPLGTVRKFN